MPEVEGQCTPRPGLPGGPSMGTGLCPSEDKDGLWPHKDSGVLGTHNRQSQLTAHAGRVLTGITAVFNALIQRLRATVASSEC